MDKVIAGELRKCAAYQMMCAQRALESVCSSQRTSLHGQPIKSVVNEVSLSETSIVYSLVKFEFLNVGQTARETRILA